MYESRGVIITHVLVTYNRSIKQGYSRARFYQPDCEFTHGPLPTLRKYPDLRSSVWTDCVHTPSDELYGCPPQLPRQNTHSYTAISKEHTQAEAHAESVGEGEEQQAAHGAVGGAEFDINFSDSDAADFDVDEDMKSRR